MKISLKMVIYVQMICKLTEDKKPWSCHVSKCRPIEILNPFLFLVKYRAELFHIHSPTINQSKSQKPKKPCGLVNMGHVDL